MCLYGFFRTRMSYIPWDISLGPSTWSMGWKFHRRFHRTEKTKTEDKIQKCKISLATQRWRVRQIFHWCRWIHHHENGDGELRYAKRVGNGKLAATGIKVGGNRPPDLNSLLQTQRTGSSDTKKNKSLYRVHTYGLLLQPGCWVQYKLGEWLGISAVSTVPPTHHVPYWFLFRSFEHLTTKFSKIVARECPLAVPVSCTRSWSNSISIITQCVSTQGFGLEK